MDNYYYPVGSDTGDAPWNEMEIPEMPFQVVGEVTLSKVMEVYTNNYDYEYEDGQVIPIAYDNVDWVDEYTRRSLSLVAILKEFYWFAQRELKYLKPESNRARFLRRMMEETRGWEITNIECTPV